MLYVIPFMLTINICQSRLGENLEKKVLKCKVEGISIEKGKIPTLTVTIEKNWIYSDLPFWYFNSGNPLPAGNFDSPHIFNYSNCPSSECQFEFYPFINKQVKKQQVSFYSGGLIFSAKKYLGTFNFPDDNDLFHIFLSNSGQLHQVPNHKLKLSEPYLCRPFPTVDSEVKLPNFSKQRISLDISDY